MYNIYQIWNIYVSNIYGHVYICIYIKDFYYMTVRIYVIQKFDKNSSDILVS